MAGERGRRILSPWELSSVQKPLLARPWEGGVAAWVIVVGATAAEIVAGIVTNTLPAAVAVPALALPVAVAAGFAAVQWWQVRSSQAEPASWWHLGGVAAALVTWLMYPTAPGVLASAGNSRIACEVLVGAYVTPDCLARAAAAFDLRDLAWWLAGFLILGAALLTRRSRIAAWAAIPTAFGGVLIASHFLELLLLHYHAGG